VDEWGRLVADVYYDGKNLADYFPEYKDWVVKKRLTRAVSRW